MKTGFQAAAQNTPWQDKSGVHKASISVYLSLCLLLVMGILFTVTESARVRAINARAGSVAYMAADSVFSAFAQPLFDEYGVMMLWEDMDELAREFSEYADGNLTSDVAGDIIFTDLYGIKRTKTDVLKVVRPVDNAAEPFADQVDEYMKIFLAEDVINRLTTGNSIFEQSGKVNDFMDSIQEYEDTFTDVEESVEDIKDKIDKAREKGKDPQVSLAEMSDALKGYIETGDSAYERQFRSARKDLKKTQSQLKGLLDDIEKKTEKYYVCAGRAKEAVNDLEQQLDREKDGYDPEIYALIREQMDDLAEKSADTQADYYDVGANSQTVAQIYNRLDMLDPMLAVTNESLTRENAGEYLALVESSRKSFEGFDLDDLGVNFDVSSVEKEDKGFLKSASRIFNSGLLDFIASEVSEKSVKTSEFPSAKMTKAQKDSPKEGLAVAAQKKVLFGEYILTHFGNAVDKLPRTALEYEAEYIIAGKKSDRDNLGAVAADIVLMRTGCNLISLLKDSAKKAETYALATSLVGFTGMPVVIKIMQLLLMAAWSLAEAIADAKTLLEGHKIETIKAGDDWFISLAGLKNFGNEKLGENRLEKGLGYEDYLRLLLLMQGQIPQRFRSLDMIQADMCLRENKDFRISKCITAADIDASFEAPQVFVSFSFARSMSGAEYGSYGFEKHISYSY